MEDDSEWERSVWSESNRRRTWFGADNGVENYFVRSNLLSFLNFGMLQAHSEPHVDGNVALAATTYHPTGYELTRHERLQAIADYVREEGLDIDTTNWSCRSTG